MISGPVENPISSVNTPANTISDGISGIFNTCSIFGAVAIIERRSSVFPVTLEKSFVSQ